MKNFDVPNFITEALNQINPQFWEEKLEELTPLEYKVSEALSNPEMREKLSSLLASKESMQ